MQKGLQTRLIIHEILFLIKFKNYNLDYLLNKKFKEANIIQSDEKLITNVVLTSMRNQFYINKIIKIYTKKKPNDHQYLILLSALTQLIYLNFTEYAVINCSVELSKIKKFKAAPNFINAVLRKALRNKDKLLNLELSKFDVPKQLYESIDFLSEKSKQRFFKSITLKPDIHCVFKKEIQEKYKKLDINQTSDKSLIFNNTANIEKITGYEEGEWWVQDYSVMLPLQITKNLNQKKVLDMCAAPGGKTFQLLCAGVKLDIIEKNKKRAKILKINLDRLNFSQEIKIIDALDINEDQKYNIIVIDSPCSSIGTIRRHPEILFRNNKTNLKEYIILQKKLLEKASKLINKNGIIIYMVCSFLKSETTMQIDNFLKKNDNFSIEKFENNLANDKLINDNGFIDILPREHSGFLIDGFFAVKFIKND